MLGRTFNQFSLESSVWTDLLPIFNSHDATIVNLETTITDSDDKWPNKAFNFKMKPENAEILLDANVKYCSLANNHILDFKLEGMMDTIKYLDALGIHHAGVGLNKRDAMQPAFLTINGIRIGFLSAADHYSYWAATAQKPGIWFIPIKDVSETQKEWISVLKHVTQIRSQCDVLVFSLHWNSNYVDEIEPIFTEFAHKLIDSGVDIIHGHSPHHLLPFEKYKGSYIFYSLGDLIDDYAIDDYYRNDLACLVSMRLSKAVTNGDKLTEKVSITMEQVYPTQISDLAVKIIAF